MPLLKMQWLDLLFAHWRIEAKLLRPLIPAALEIDLWEGDAWIGLVPFRMRGVGPVFVPGGSSFAELNVRTYVRHRGQAGVWFFSLDAASKVGVRLARRFFYLPYFDARMSVTPRGDGFLYASERTHRHAPPAALRMTYSPTGAEFGAAPDTREHWLTSRYALFSANPSGQLYRGNVSHEPWRLQPATASFEQLEMGFPMAGAPESLLFSRHLDVRAGALVKIDA
ncbi:MAG: DUF2071 domain-containing protein [Bryobacteraceae bacterium]|nr:DUF2071 domain-containing protein [Bryobacteraceae bacterium]